MTVWKQVADPMPCLAIAPEAAQVERLADIPRRKCGNLDSETAFGDTEMTHLSQTNLAAIPPQTNQSPLIQTAPGKLPPAFMYVISCHSDNCMTYASPQIASLGFAMEDWIGKPDLRLRQIHGDDLEKFVEAMRHSRNTAEAFSCQYRLYDNCGKLGWFHDEASVVCDKSGVPLFFSGVMLDITEKKEMEAELNEHRYCLERNVERRTEQLVKSMSLLESCNAALCDKLALTQRELAALKQQMAGTIFGTASNDCTESLMETA